MDLQLAQERFCNEWMSVDDTMAAALDVKIRDAGWHFIWLHTAQTMQRTPSNRRTGRN
jgi:hypothetical protein